MAAPLSDFERFVLPFVPDAPLVAVHDAIVDASIEFCIRTRTVREILADFMVYEESDVELYSPTNSDIVEVLAVWLYGRKLQAASRADLDAAFPQGWQTLITADLTQIRSFCCPVPDRIHLVPGSAQYLDDALTVEMAVAPRRNTSDLPDLLYTRYPEIIAIGALARLHQHSAPYADPARAVSYLELFHARCNALAHEPELNYQKTPLRIIPEHW